MLKRGICPKVALSFLFFLLSMSWLQGCHPEIEASLQENIGMDVEADIPLSNLMGKIEALIGEPLGSPPLLTLLEVQSPKIELSSSKRPGQALAYPRDYYAPLTAREHEDVHFIVTTLAYRSLSSIVRAKSKLEEAGDRIDHLHPLKFLTCILSDEEMKVCLRNIRSRGIIGHQFFRGIKDTLATEASVDNLKFKEVQHFAALMRVDAEQIFPFVKERQWDAFIDSLIASIPRAEGHDRYDS